MSTTGRLVYLGCAGRNPCKESQVWTVLYHAPVKASYRYRGDVQIVADCVIMSPSGVVCVAVRKGEEPNCAMSPD